MKSSGHKAHESIRIEAYLLSEKAGHPPGMDDYFWSEAQLIVAARTAAKPGTPKRLAVKGKAKPGPAKKSDKKAEKKASKKKG